MVGTQVGFFLTLIVLVPQVQSVCQQRCIENGNSGVPPLSNPLAVPLNSSQYFQSIQSGSVGVCSVSVVPFAEVISQVNYFVVDSSGDIFRRSFGFQYYSKSRKTFRYEQTFQLDWSYDESHAGSQIYETALLKNGTFTDIAVNPNGGKHCVAVAGFPFVSTDMLCSDTVVSDYAGIVQFDTNGPTWKGGVYDVYAVYGQWLVPSTVIFFFINRENGEMDLQLYHQSEDGGPNYFWDLKTIKEGSQAQSLFDQNPDYYFTLGEELTNCPESSGFLHFSNSFFVFLSVFVVILGFVLP